MPNYYEGAFDEALLAIFDSFGITNVPLELITEIRNYRKQEEPIAWSKLLAFEKEAIYQFIFKLMEKNSKFYVVGNASQVKKLLEAVFNVVVSDSIANKLLIKARRTLSYLKGDIDEVLDWESLHDHLDKWLLYNFNIAGITLKTLHEKLKEGKLKDAHILQLFEKTSSNFAKMLELKLAVLTHLKNNKYETMNIREQLRKLLEETEEDDSFEKINMNEENTLF